MDSDPGAGGWRIGRILAGITALALLSDGLLRLVPISEFSFRAWEAARHERPPAAPFAPRFTFSRERSFGDLANMANLPDLREIHPDRFSTDEHGFRNPPAVPGRPPGAILLGSSFSGGAGLSDDETLSARLADLLGVPVYNAAGRDFGVGEVRALAKRLGMGSGWVIHEQLSRNPLPIPGEPSRRRESTDSAWRRLGRRVRNSRLEILCSNLYRRLQDDRFLPNVHSRNVVRRSLADGSPLLFLPGEDSVLHTQAQVQGSVAYWSKMASDLAKDGLELLVVLVPDKHLVYAPLLQGGGEDGGAKAAAMGQVASELRRAGVAALDLVPVLQRRAAERAREGGLLYRRDDTHWNPEGVRVAAEAVAGVLKR